MERNRRGAIYIRVSTHMQEELSPDAQKRLILNYAGERKISVAPENIYVESGVSGRRADKRPVFQRMIADAKSGQHPFDVILVWKFSRFARNQEESIVYKSLLAKQCHIEVQSVSEPLVEGPFGSLIERIIEWMDEYYSIRLSGEVFRGMSEKALRGGYLARPPLGYRIRVPGEPPEIVPEEAGIVRLIFDWYVNKKLSLFEITRELNRLELKTAVGKSFERRSVAYILQNPTYCGMIRWNRTSGAANGINPPGEWIVAEGRHPAIISRELFERAQKRCRETDRPTGARPSAACRHWLSGLVKCPECGRSMTVKSTGDRTGKRTYRYFVCCGYTKGKCPTSHSVSVQKLETSILRALRVFLDTGNREFAYREPISETAKQEKAEVLQASLKRLRAKEQRSREAYLGGIDTLEEYRENKRTLCEEGRIIEEELKKMSEETSGDAAARSPAAVRGICDIFESDAAIRDKNEAAKQIIEKIVYRKEEDVVDIQYRLS